MIEKNPPLTKEQQKLAEENLPLVYAFMEKNNLDREVYEGELLEKYTKIIRSFDPTKAKISTYVFTCLGTQTNRIKEHFQRKDRYKELNNVSLDEELTNKDGDDGDCTLYDFIDSEVYVEDYDNQKILNDFINELPEREQKILKMSLKGYTLQEIGNEVGLSRERIRQILCTKIKRKLLQNKIVSKRKDGHYVFGAY